MHSLWTQLEQPPQKMEYVLTPLWQAPQGSLPDFWSTSSPGPDIRTSVLPMFTRSPFPSMLVFQRSSFFYGSSSDSVMMTRSSTYRFPRDILYGTLGRGLPEPRWTVGGSDLFKINKGHVLSFWWHRTFLLTGVQWICRRLLWHESKPHVIDAHLLP